MTKDPVYRELNDGKKVTDITLAVQRGYKNYEGTYDTDFFPVTIWDQLATITNEYTYKGQMLLVKGRIVPKKEKDTLESGVVVQNFSIQADKVVFLSHQTKAVED